MELCRLCSIGFLMLTINPKHLPFSGGSVRRIACNLMNLNQVYEKQKMRISLHVLSQLVLKYAYMLDILIHQFVHMEFFDSS